MSRCSQCLCVPAECSQCFVCASQGCCASAHARPRSRVAQFFSHARGMFAAALGIEVLCISFAELGENAGLYAFGFNPAGIAMAYAMGYALAGLATFLTILGRSRGAECGDGCCSILENAGRKGFWPNFMGTMRDFAVGAKRLARIDREKNLKAVLKSSLVILVTAESACILAAETAGLALYQYSILLSAPLALLAGTSVIVAQQAFKKVRAG
ncbi:MAG: hypothetical protein ACREAY_03210 [Nitrososphaera sp.]|uniref:hypothetical protein n=1 Tax=Nitrososphaera sp. TaxID=1971748 RepID=UPI003D6E1EFE